MGANENDESGSLTTLELRIVDLTGTKLVVLSGCDTGLGEIKNWQGVYGLKRTLILAGSQTQMISCRSLRRVQLDCLNRNFNEKSKDFSHPYYWTSFVVSGK